MSLSIDERWERNLAARGKAEVEYCRFQDFMVVRGEIRSELNRLVTEGVRVDAGYYLKQRTDLTVRYLDANSTKGPDRIDILNGIIEDLVQLRNDLSLRPRMLEASPTNYLLELGELRRGILSKVRALMDAGVLIDANYYDCTAADLHHQGRVLVDQCGEGQEVGKIVQLTALLVEMNALQAELTSGEIKLDQAKIAGFERFQVRQEEMNAPRGPNESWFKFLTRRLGI